MSNEKLLQTPCSLIHREGNRVVGILVDWHTFGSNRVRYFHRFLPPCCANRVGPEGKELRLLMAAADLWFPELNGYEVRVADSMIRILVIALNLIKPLFYRSKLS